MIDKSAKSFGVSAKFIQEDAKCNEVNSRSIHPTSCPRHGHVFNPRKHRRVVRYFENILCRIINLKTNSRTSSDIDVSNMRLTSVIICQANSNNAFAKECSNCHFCQPPDHLKAWLLGYNQQETFASVPEYVRKKHMVSVRILHRFTNV